MDAQQNVTIAVKGKYYTAVYSVKDRVITVVGNGPEAITTKMYPMVTGYAMDKITAGLLLEEMVEAGRVIPN